MAVSGHSVNIEFLEVDNVIYETAETTTRPTAQEKGPQKILPDRRRYKWVGVGLLCAVLALLSIAVPLYVCQSCTVERELQNSCNQSLDRINNLTRERDQLLDSNNNLTRERDDLKMRLCESPGWQKIDRSCYYISTEKKKTWEDSRQWCTERHSDLIVIKSKEKQDFVASFNKRVWLGLTDRETEGSFQWVDGTPLTTPTYWYPGEPHAEDNKHPNAELDCVEYYDGSESSFPNRGWSDALCSASLYWMCERDVC